VERAVVFEKGLRLIGNSEVLEKLDTTIFRLVQEM
jgi:hypothetical protein